jgi:platelet-activating factor acetylhydrolase IB subunit beta/gamma
MQAYSWFTLRIRFQIIILHCGTNNSPVNTADEIAEGIVECVTQIRKRHSESFIVIPTLLPRGAQPNALRDKNEKINSIIKEKLQGVSKVQIVDISNGLIQTDGTISHHDLHDYLNLTNAASKKLFEPVWDLLNQILNEDEKEVLLTPSE